MRRRGEEGFESDGLELFDKKSGRALKAAG
jgi:hypothetical protein